MSVRIIKYTVSENGVSPANIQQGGFQDEHNATRLDFAVDEMLLQKLTSAVGEGKLFYHFDGYDGAGGVASTEAQEYVGEEMSYSLENWITRFGGRITVYLVFTACDSETFETLMELYSFPAVLNIKEKPLGELIENEEYESIPALAHLARVAAKRAEAAADASEIAKIKTESSRAALESGTKWVFDGGDAFGPSLPLKVVIDNELSLASDNPVSNRVTTKKLQDMSLTFADIQKALIDMMHPIGSVYISFDETTPAEIYGGEWEQLKDRFLLACGDKYEIDSIGGESSHVLTIDEMPRHTHKIYRTTTSGTKDVYTFTNSAGKGANETFANTEFVGSNAAHNNMPPYIAVYMWRRIG